MATAAIISAMLKCGRHVSDLIFSPGKLPQVESNGQLVGVKIPTVDILGAEDTARIAGDLIGSNKHAVEKLRQDGSCDIFYSLAKLSRFRVNIFTQRGSCAIGALHRDLVSSSDPLLKLGRNAPSVHSAISFSARQGIVLFESALAVFIRSSLTATFFCRANCLFVPLNSGFVFFRPNRRWLLLSAFDGL